MQKELLNYYDQELKYLREMGQEFARSYPRMASWLATGQNEYPDPHVGQIVQGFALLAAKIHLQLDDDFGGMLTGDRQRHFRSLGEHSQFLPLNLLRLRK